MAKTFYGCKVIRQDGKSLDGKVQFVKNEWHEGNSQYVTVNRDMLKIYGSNLLAYFACQEPVRVKTIDGIMCFSKIMWIDDCPERLQSEDSGNIKMTDKQQRDQFAIFNDRSKSPKQIFVKDLTGENKPKVVVSIVEKIVEKKIEEPVAKTTSTEPIAVRKGTLTAYVLEKMMNNPMDVTDLAQMYKTEFKDARLLQAIKANISTALNQLKKKGADVVKISCGRYAIRVKNEK